MKRLTLPFLAMLLVVAAAYGQTISQDERQKAINHLEKTRNGIVEATKGLSSTQWTFKPGPFRWSVAQCVEHLALSEGFLFQIATERALKAPALATRKTAQQAADGDSLVLKAISDRSSRFQAPEPLRPSKQSSATPEQMLQQFLAGRARTIDYARATQEDLRGHCIDNQLLKCTDAYQWLLFVSAHSERHLAQLLEVKADPNFPKR